MSLALNIIVTVLIVLRLLVYRHRIVRAMGKGHGSHYTSLAAMIIESAAINSAFSLLFLIPFAFNSPIAQLFLQGLAMVQVSSSDRLASAIHLIGTPGCIDVSYHLPRRYGQRLVATNIYE
jgi:hypothetical protein